MISALVQKSAVLLLLTFLIGGVVSPVVGHAVHPHVVVHDVDVAKGPVLGGDTPTTPCALCDAAMTAMSFCTLNAAPLILCGDLHDAGHPGWDVDAHLELSTRGPPSA